MISALAEDHCRSQSGLPAVLHRWRTSIGKPRKTATELQQIQPRVETSLARATPPERSQSPGERMKPLAKIIFISGISILSCAVAIYVVGNQFFGSSVSTESVILSATRNADNQWAIVVRRNGGATTNFTYYAVLSSSEASYDLANSFFQLEETGVGVQTYINCEWHPEYLEVVYPRSARIRFRDPTVELGSKSWLIEYREK
ncbi:MAG: hypothetical protein K8R88_06930 [Armatimonadetes bacterium]|nr:hypothetical protein [Armatimonadota bacterium]